MRSEKKYGCGGSLRREENLTIVKSIGEGMLRKVSDGECKMGLVGMVVFFSLFSYIKLDRELIFFFNLK